MNETNKGIAIKLNAEGHLSHVVVFHETTGAEIENYEEVMKDVDPHSDTLSTSDRVSKCLQAIEGSIEMPEDDKYKGRLNYFMWLLGVIMLNSPEGLSSELKSWMVVYDDSGLSFLYMNAAAVDYAHDVSETATGPFTFESFLDSKEAV